MEAKNWNISELGMAFDPSTGDSFQLNDSARLILRMLQHGSPEREIAEILARTFAIDFEQALTDVMEFEVQLKIVGKSL